MKQINSKYLILKSTFLIITSCLAVNSSNILNEETVDAVIQKVESTVNNALSPKINPEEIMRAKNIDCNTVNCLPQLGICIDKSTCWCNDGHANLFVNENQRKDQYCSYVRKSQLVAFLLEFFIPIGTSHFYLGNITTGVYKLLVVLVLPTLFFCLSFCCVAVTKNLCGMAISCLGVGAACVGAVWEIYDLVNLIMNNYTDSNGVTPNPW